MLERIMPPVGPPGSMHSSTPLPDRFRVAHGIANFVTDFLPVPGEISPNLLHEAATALPRGLATEPPKPTGNAQIDQDAQTSYSNARLTLELHSKRMETVIPIANALVTAQEILSRFGQKRAWTATIAAGLGLTNAACAHAMEASGGDEGGGASREVIQVNASGYDSETGTPQQRKELNGYALEYMPGAVDPFTMFSTLEDDRGMVVKEEVFLADKNSGETKTVRKATDGTVQVYETTQNVDPETGEKLIIGYKVDKDGNPTEAEVLERYKLNGNIVVLDEQSTEEPFMYKGEPQQLQFKSNGAVIPLGVGKRAYEVAISKGARIKTAISGFFDRFANKAQAADQAGAVITGTPTPETKTPQPSPTAEVTETKIPATQTPGVTKVAVVPPQGGGEATQEPTEPPPTAPPTDEPPPATPEVTQVAQVVDPPATAIPDEQTQNQSENENITNPHTYERQIGQVTQSVTIGLGPDMKGKYSDWYVEKQEWEEKILDGVLYGHYETFAFLNGQEPSLEGFADFKVKYGDPSQDLSYEVVDTSKGFKELKTVRVDPRQSTTLTLVDTTKNNGIIVYKPNGHSVSSYVTIDSNNGLILRPIFMEDNLSSGAGDSGTAILAIIAAFKMTHIPLDQFTAHNDPGLSEGQWFFDIGRWQEKDPTGGKSSRTFTDNFIVTDSNGTPVNYALTLK